jgi:excisionase family DNA binding protein
LLRQGDKTLRILSLAEVAERLGCSRRTIERAISIGEGPTLMQISMRRIGIAEHDYEAWIARRRRPAPGTKQAS